MYTCIYTYMYIFTLPSGGESRLFTMARKLQHVYVKATQKRSKYLFFHLTYMCQENMDVLRCYIILMAIHVCSLIFHTCVCDRNCDVMKSRHVFKEIQSDILLCFVLLCPQVSFLVPLRGLYNNALSGVVVIIIVIVVLRCLCTAILSTLLIIETSYFVYSRMYMYIHGSLVVLPMKYFVSLPTM